MDFKRITLVHKTWQDRCTLDLALRANNETNEFEFKRIVIAEIKQEKFSPQCDFNLVLKEESEKRGIRYFNITTISRTALTDDSLIASDGLHPSGKMYKLWVDKMIPVISKINFD